MCFLFLIELTFSLAAASSALPTWAPGYAWSQTEDSVCLSFEIAPRRAVVDIKIEFTQDELRAGVEGEPWRIVGALHHAVLPSDCTWVLETRKDYGIVDIHLQKSVPISWPYPIKEDGADGTPMDAQSEIELARHYESAGNLDSAMEHMQRAADKGSVQALLTLAKLHHMGQNTAYGLPQNLDLAADHYERAAALGSAEAHYLRGTIFQERGQHNDAARCFRAACGDDSIKYACTLDRARRDLPPYIVASFFNLGILYQDGSKDLPVNISETIKWWNLAANQQFAPALFNLGVLYLNGQGVARDEAKAQSLFERANKLNAKLAIPHIPSSTGRRAPAAPAAHAYSPAAAAAPAPAPSSATPPPPAATAAAAASPSAFHSPRPHAPADVFAAAAAAAASPHAFASPAVPPPRTNIDDVPDFRTPVHDSIPGDDGGSMWKGVMLAAAAGIGIYLFGRIR